ncbi:MAG TPA: hypothetical protein VFJ24_11035 [Gaiellales bacterium]|nr:hypothetical protein [Gaiellales bacterium]
MNAMRRFLLIVAVLAGLWVLFVVIRASRSAPAPDGGIAEPEPEVAPEDDHEPTPVFIAEDEEGEVTERIDDVPSPPAPHATPEVVAARVAGADGEDLQAEVLRLRADIEARVERRTLFTMAEERHVPYFRLFFMTKPELLEAVMEAERIPPPDVLPSPETVERVRALADEAFRRNREIAAEEASQPQAG